MAAAMERVIEAAGGVLWRTNADHADHADHAGRARVEIALVHRPKYDDWSLPKGKLVAAEHPLLGALREIVEETGFVGRPGRRLGETRYLKDGVPKRVRYWAVEATGGAFVPGDEVDELRWLPPREAAACLAPERDRGIAEAFAQDVRATTPIVVVRHGSAGDRASWLGADRDRPLDETGRRQAGALVGVLSAFGIERLLSADVMRCAETFAPFAELHGVPIESEPLFSEAGFAAAPEAAVQCLHTLIAHAAPMAICSQGKAIAPLLRGVCAALPEIEAPPKGGFVVMHIARASEPDVVAVDGYPA